MSTKWQKSSCSCSWVRAVIAIENYAQLAGDATVTAVATTAATATPATTATGTAAATVAVPAVVAPVAIDAVTPSHATCRAGAGLRRWMT